MAWLNVQFNFIFENVLMGFFALEVLGNVIRKKKICMILLISDFESDTISILLQIHKLITNFQWRTFFFSHPSIILLFFSIINN